VVKYLHENASDWPIHHRTCQRFATLRRAREALPRCTVRLLVLSAPSHRNESPRQLPEKMGGAAHAWRGGAWGLIHRQELQSLEAQASDAQTPGAAADLDLDFVAGSFAEDRRGEDAVFERCRPGAASDATVGSRHWLATFRCWVPGSLTTELIQNVWAIESFATNAHPDGSFAPPADKSSARDGRQALAIRLRTWERRSTP